MANDPATTDQVDGHRDLAAKALSLLTSMTSDVVLVELGEDAPLALAAADLKIRHELRPVPTEEDDRVEWNEAMDERLRRLAAKVLPTAGDAAQAWREAMVEALSDLPAMIALTAARRAIHTPFRFVGEIEVEIRRIAAELMMRRNARLLLIAALRRKLDQPIEIAAAVPSEPISEASRLRTNAFLRRIGIHTQLAADGEVYSLAPDIDAQLDRGDVGDRHAA